MSIAVYEQQGRVLVPADQARGALLFWVREGYILSEVSRAAGLSKRALTNLLRGESPSVSHVTDARVRALTRESLDAARVRVPVQEVLEVVEYWHRRGYTLRDISRASGVPYNTLFEARAGRRGYLLAQTIRTLNDLSDERLVAQAPRNRAVPTHATAAHLRGLTEAGFGLRHIARAAGVHHFLPSQIVNGQKMFAKAQSQRSLLALTYQNLFASAEGSARVPNYGVRRRYEALAATGWPLAEIDTFATQLGVRRPLARVVENAGRVSDGREQTFARVHHDFDKVYRHMRHIPGPSKRVRMHAAAHDWISPDRWKDIDDPNEHPLPDWAEQDLEQEQVA